MHIPLTQRSGQRRRMAAALRPRRAYRLVAAYGLERPGVHPHQAPAIPARSTTSSSTPTAEFRRDHASSLVKVDQDCNKLSDSPFRSTRRLRDPQRHPPGARGRRLRAAHPLARRRGSERAEMRHPADQPASTFVLVRWPTMTTKASPCATTRSRACRRTSATPTTWYCATTACDGGRSIADAFLAMYTFENTCRIQLGRPGRRRAGPCEPANPSPAWLPP